MQNELDLLKMSAKGFRFLAGLAKRAGNLATMEKMAGNMATLDKLAGNMATLDKMAEMGRRMAIRSSSSFSGNTSKPEYQGKIS